MIERFARLPASLEKAARRERFGDVPALLAHPDWKTPAPMVLWMHGRSVNKELDPGRYLRWLRAGVATCAIDLPYHGERDGPTFHGPEHSMRVLAQAVGEIDGVLSALRSLDAAEAIDFSCLGIGGMSAGGMVTLRRLCEPHPFVCAAVEATTGDLSGLPRYDELHDPADVARNSAMEHLATFEPLPLLVLHSEADQTVPWACQERFLDALGSHYEQAGADAPIEVHTWPQTGAPYEHAGFGRFANDAKNLQTAFFARHLLGREPGASE